VPALTLGELRARPAECSSRVAARVAAAREIPTHRGGPNAALGPAEILEHCPLDRPARQLVDTAFERLALSAAALHRVLRVARTLADLAGARANSPREGQLSDPARRLSLAAGAVLLGSDHAGQRRTGEGDGRRPREPVAVRGNWPVRQFTAWQTGGHTDALTMALLTGGCAERTVARTP
jgi:hypothetical protein